MRYFPNRATHRAIQGNLRKVARQTSIVVLLSIGA
jgi:hypothetical protein